MQELVRMESKGTMTSLQLVEVINNERAKIDKKKLLRHDVLLCIIRDEFTDELGVQNILESSYLNSQNKRLPMFELTISQCKQVLVRESKNVRRKVIARLEELESKTPIPQTYLEALKALVVAEEAKQQAIFERDNAIATKAEIGARREATAMNTASQAVKQVNKLQIELDKSKSYASVKVVQEFVKQPIKWQLLKDYCNAKELEIKKVFDANYGEVNAYPAEAWFEVYGVDLKEIF